MRRFLFILIFFIINVGCDSDRFISSHISDLSGYDSTAVFGFVYRLDTGEPVAGALARVELTKTNTNDEGFFTCLSFTVRTSIGTSPLEGSKIFFLKPYLSVKNKAANRCHYMAQTGTRVWGCLE